MSLDLTARRTGRQGATGRACGHTRELERAGAPAGVVPGVKPAKSLIPPPGSHTATRSPGSRTDTEQPHEPGISASAPSLALVPDERMLAPLGAALAAGASPVLFDPAGVDDHSEDQAVVDMDHALAGTSITPARQVVSVERRGQGIVVQPPYAEMFAVPTTAKHEHASSGIADRRRLPRTHTRRRWDREGDGNT